jgi:hypothetical protein
LTRYFTNTVSFTGQWHLSHHEREGNGRSDHEVDLPPHRKSARATTLCVSRSGSENSPSLTMREHFVVTYRVRHYRSRLRMDVWTAAGRFVGGTRSLSLE